MSKSESSAIKVTLTMSKDTARSVLGILARVLEEGDRNMMDEPEKFDKLTIAFHNEIKANITRDVLDPIHAEFPADVLEPADLIGHKVFFPIYLREVETTVEGMVTACDSHNPAHVIIVDPHCIGNHSYSVHWLQCRADHLNITGS
jgi:hypothetical protein